MSFHTNLPEEKCCLSLHHPLRWQSWISAPKPIISSVQISKVPKSKSSENCAVTRLENYPPEDIFSQWVTDLVILMKDIEHCKESKRFWININSKSMLMLCYLKKLRNGIFLRLCSTLHTRSSSFTIPATSNFGIIISIQIIR